MRFIRLAGITIFLLSIFLPLVSANLLISPMPLEVNATNLQQTIYTINLTNNYTFDIYNIRFAGIQDVTFPTISLIKAKNTTTANIVITTSTAYDRQLQSLVKFDYKIDLTQNLTNKYVIINQSGFVPNIVEIYQGSFINWTNKDNIPHTITSSLFDQTLSSGQSYVYTFPNPLNLSYYDKNTNYQGMVVVKNITQGELVNSPIYDINYPIHIVSKLLDTTIEAELFQTNFSVKYNGDISGAIRVKNTGSKTASGIKLKMIWTDFVDNNFDLTSSQDKLVVFTIRPVITDLNNTGKYFNLTLDITSNNTNFLTYPLTIYIPNETAINESKTACDVIAVLQKKKELCEKFPQSIECISEPIIKEVIKIEYRSPPVPYNYSQEDIDRINRNFLELVDTNQKMQNFIKEQIDAQSTKVGTMEGIVNQVVKVLNDIENEKRQILSLETDRKKWTSIIMWTTIILVVMGAIFVLLIVIIKKHSENELIKT